MCSSDLHGGAMHEEGPRTLRGIARGVNDALADLPACSEIVRQSTIKAARTLANQACASGARSARCAASSSLPVAMQRTSK